MFGCAPRQTHRVMSSNRFHGYKNSSAGIFWVDLENELEDELEEDPGIGSSVFSRVKTIAAGVATNPTMDSNHISSPSISESCYTEETDTTASFPLTESPLARELFSRQIDWTIPRSPLTIDDLERLKVRTHLQAVMICHSSNLMHA